MKIDKIETVPMQWFDFSAFDENYYEVSDFVYVNITWFLR